MSNAIKKQVLETVANGKDLYKIGRAEWLIGDRRIHVRFCARPKSDGVTYGCNVNPTTLAADYELWICTDHETYYLIPMDVISSMYHHPDSYVDSWHPQMRVMGVDTSCHLTGYARGRKKQFNKYFKAIL